MSRIFEADNSAILYLALMRRRHANVYRFTMTMTEPVCPDTLQRAVDRVYRRFPTIICGFKPGFFKHTCVQPDTPPLVRPDPGCLITMQREEIEHCAWRVFYRDSEITFEAFHAVTDGYGAIASFTTLVAEYLRMKHGIQIPVEDPLRCVEEGPKDQEVRDEYLHYAQGKPLHLPSRYAYQLPTRTREEVDVLTTREVIPTQALLDAAHRRGVSATALICAVMACAIMEVQSGREKRLKPVRIMVPVDLRRLFPSRTLRNFILYALPTLEVRDKDKPLQEIAGDFARQLKEQVEPKRMASIMAYNVKAQANPLFRAIPQALKLWAMRTAYHYFGESNSCITLTNLGSVKLPEEMAKYVLDLEVILTPRDGSPYNCAILSYGDHMNVNLSRFCREPELDEIFFRKLKEILN